MLDRLYRIPIPRPLLLWFGLTFLLVAAELAFGASIGYAAGLLISFACYAFAIILAGGVRTFPGIIITGTAAQGYLLAPFLKAIYGQTGDLRLDRPFRIHLAYAVMMLSLGAGAYIFRKFVLERTRPLIQPITNIAMLRGITYVFVISSISVNILQFIAPNNIFRQLSGLSQIAFAFLTGYAITASDGKKSFHFLMLAVCIPGIISDFMTGGRSNLMYPLLIYVIVCLLYGFRLRRRFLIFLAAYVVFFVTLVIPWGLTARNVLMDSHLPPLEAMSWSYKIFNLQFTDKRLFDLIRFGPKRLQNPFHQRIFFFLDRDVGADRYALVRTSDLIFQGVDDQGLWGWQSIKRGFEFLIPTFITGISWHHNTNQVVHRVDGFIGKTDYSTGIVTGLLPDTYSSFGWLGVILEPLVLLFLICTVWSIIFNIQVQRNPMMIGLSFYISSVLAAGNVESWIDIMIRMPLLVGGLSLFAYYLGSLVLRKHIVSRNPAR